MFRRKYFFVVCCAKSQVSRKQPAQDNRCQFLQQPHFSQVPVSISRLSRDVSNLVLRNWNSKNSRKLRHECFFNFPQKVEGWSLPSPYTASFQAFLGQCIFGDVSETNGRETPRQSRSAHARTFLHFWKVHTFNWNNLLQK